jgi:hypothetical protein
VFETWCLSLRKRFAKQVSGEEICYDILSRTLRDTKPEIFSVKSEGGERRG